MRTKLTWTLLLILTFLVLSCRENREGTGQTEAEIVSPSTRARDPDINEFIKVDEPPQLVKRVHPKYPESAEKTGMNCVVYTKAFVTESGLVKKAVVIKREGGTPEVEQLVIEAAQQWKFTPAKLNGKPTPVWVVIPFKFQVKTNQVSVPERSDE